MYNNRMRMALLLQLLLFCNILYGQELCIFYADDEITGTYNADNTNGDVYEITDGRHIMIYSAESNDKGWVVSVPNVVPSEYICQDLYEEAVPPQACTSWIKKTTSLALQCGDFYSNAVSKGTPNSLYLSIPSSATNKVAISTKIIASDGSSVLPTSLKVTDVTESTDSGQLAFPEGKDSGNYTLEIVHEETSGTLQIIFTCLEAPAIKMGTGSCELCVSYNDDDKINGEYRQQMKNSYTKVTDDTVTMALDTKWVITVKDGSSYTCNVASVLPEDCETWISIQETQDLATTSDELKCGDAYSMDNVEAGTKSYSFKPSFSSSDITASFNTESSTVTIDTLTLQVTGGTESLGTYSNNELKDVSVKNSESYTLEIDVTDGAPGTLAIDITCSSIKTIDITASICEDEDEDELNPVLLIIIVAINVIVIIIAIIIIITICLRRKKAATAIQEKDDEQESMLTEEQVKKRLDLLDLDKFEDQHAERLEAKRLKSVAILGSNIDVDIDVNDSDAPKM